LGTIRSFCRFAGLLRGALASTAFGKQFLSLWQAILVGMIRNGAVLSDKNLAAFDDSFADGFAVPKPWGRKGMGKQVGGVGFMPSGLGKSGYAGVGKGNGKGKGKGKGKGVWTCYRCNFPANWFNFECCKMCDTEWTFKGTQQRQAKEELAKRAVAASGKSNRRNEPGSQGARFGTNRVKELGEGWLEVVVRSIKKQEAQEQLEQAKQAHAGGRGKGDNVEQGGNGEEKEKRSMAAPGAGKGGKGKRPGAEEMGHKGGLEAEIKAAPWKADGAGALKGKGKGKGAKSEPEVEEEVKKAQKKAAKCDKGMAAAKVLMEIAVEEGGEKAGLETILEDLKKLKEKFIDEIKAKKAGNLAADERLWKCNARITRLQNKREQLQIENQEMEKMVAGIQAKMADNERRVEDLGQSIQKEKASRAELLEQVAEDYGHGGEDSEADGEWDEQEDDENMSSNSEGLGYDEFETGDDEHEGPVAAAAAARDKMGRRGKRKRTPEAAAAAASSSPSLPSLAMQMRKVLNPEASSEAANLCASINAFMVKAKVAGWGGDDIKPPGAGDSERRQEGSVVAAQGPVSADVSWDIQLQKKQGEVQAQLEAGDERPEQKERAAIIARLQTLEEGERKRAKPY
jgi:hypothetical protein